MADDARAAGANVQTLGCDLSRLTEVRAAADKTKELAAGGRVQPPNASSDAVCEYPKAQLAKSRPRAPRATIAPGHQLWDITFDSSGNMVPDYYSTSVSEYSKADLTKSGSPPAHVAEKTANRRVDPREA